MIFHRSVICVFAISISTTLMLSACQPTNQEVVIGEDAMSSIDEETANTIVDPHAGHDMANDIATDATSMTEVYKEYNTAMTQMHKQMMASASYNDPDSAFAQGMLGHHNGAVAMASIQLKYGTDEEMRELAETIIAAQQIEIEQMQSWLATHPDVGAPMKDTQAMQQAYADGMNDMHGEMMLGISDSSPDRAFARGMLPHHKGAVAMAMIQLQFGKDPEMRQLAQEIIDVQELEIMQMQNWLDEQTR